MAQKQEERRKNEVVNVMRYQSYCKQLNVHRIPNGQKWLECDFWGHLEKRKLETLIEVILSRS